MGWQRTASSAVSILAPMQRIAICVLFSASAAAAQAISAQSVWVLQDSGTTAGLRGIDSVDGKVAWASGTGGTVLRTLDGGAHWSKCATPDVNNDGGTLDFRGIQMWDAQTAVVMASGSGKASRLYKTTDGCSSWRLLFANPDSPGGFFDSFWFNGSQGMLVGDPVRGKMAVFLTRDYGKEWKRDEHPGLAVQGSTQAVFAASNTAIPIGNRLFARAFAAGGTAGAMFFNRPFQAGEELKGIVDKVVRKEPPWKTGKMPLRGGTESSGAFSVAYQYPITEGGCGACAFSDYSMFVAVGGDYASPNESSGTAAWSADGGFTWTAAAKPPHGYRSGVAWSAQFKAWIAVGANGSDISRDQGQTWQPLDDGSWNAVSLPFVVGPKGRIARLNASAIPPPRKAGVTKSAAGAP